MDAYLQALEFDAVEQVRYRELLRDMNPWSRLFAGKDVLDFGCSWGLSAVAFAHLGAATVVGIEPDADRVKQGTEMVEQAGLADRVHLHHVADTRRTGLEGPFAFVAAIAVLEHIPQPRDSYIREMWRLVAPSGHLMVHETPNSLWPKEHHTTHLWFNHWLPEAWAHRRAVKRGSFDPSRTDWTSSGWRGVHYRELVRPLSDYELIPERLRTRHRVLSAFGLPAGLLDPWPTWVLRKLAS